MEALEFKEYKKQTREQSSVWNFFLRTMDGTYAKCKQCNSVIKCQNTTTCLHNHLKRHRERDHNEASTSSTERAVSEPQKRAAQKDFGQINPKKKSRIDEYFQTTEDTMETMISKMTACDGLPFRIFCTSESIRTLFHKSGYKNLPRSPTTIQKIVLTKSNEIKNILKRELAILKSEGKKFSVTLDEWTSDSNRRYMNINIHCPYFKDNKTFKNLGLARIKGRATADCCVNILQRKLVQYDLCMETDIACAVTDGASVMCLLGKKVPSHHQQCLAHGIQCAVIDAIYKKQENDREEQEEWVDMTTSGEETGSEFGDSDTEEENYGFVVHLANQNRIYTLLDYKDLIDRVRKVVKFFKISPTRTETLNNYLSEENKNLRLILDCKTRWSSLASMIERFLVLKDAVMKALIDLKNTITFSTVDFKILEDFSSSLNVVKATVEAICQEKANMLTAEAALQFMVSKLQSQAENSIISRRLLSAMKERITQRRREDLVSTLKYLHNPTKYYNELPSASDVFTCAGNDVITHLIISINKKYFGSNPATQPTEDIVEHQDRIETVQVVDETSLKEQLQKTIDSTMSETASKSSITLTNEEEFETSIRMEMAIFDRGGPRQVHLNQACEFLLCIPPTSVECERVFSSAKYITNHLRCSLSDNSIDALSFLRSFYQGQGN